MNQSLLMPRLGRFAALAIVAALMLALIPAAQAQSAPNGTECEELNGSTFTKLSYRQLLDCVTVEGVRDHQAALQAIADANDGNRSAGTAGYTDSAAYVIETLEAAGWNVEVNEFPFTYFAPALLEQVTPVAAVYETGSFTGTGAGDVTGPTIGVDLALEPPRESTSGCEIEDFDGLDFSGPNDIALIQRGACAFADKAINAEASGAEAVIIFNQGNDPTREGLIIGTLGGLDVVGIPVVGASFADGEALSVDGATAHVDVDPPEDRPQINVIAELPGRLSDNVVMAGAHLDSVQRGPGIQDNGSGSGALLEVAEQMAGLTPHNTLRFAWWGAEEAGLLGSTAYVDGLSEEALAEIALYLNFDMIGSPNYIFMTYDGNESGFEASAPVPEGSIQIEETFESFYTYAGEPYDDAEFSGRSDYQAFINNDIPAGGLFTGAEVVKTDEQVAIWGGVAGDQYDPCYHLACDTFDNISLHALDVNADAVAFAVLTYAYSTESVNGVRGKKVPGRANIPEPAGPEGTVGSDGGLDHGHLPY